MEIIDIPGSLPETPSKDNNEHEYCFCAFSKAVDESNEEFINVFLSKEEFIQGVFTSDKVTPLHVVAKRGTVETADKMCKLGADINFQNKHGETPIFHAVKNSTEMVKFLINNGASVDIECWKGVTLLHRALIAGSEETVQIILNAIFTHYQKSGYFQNLNYPISIQNSEEIVKTLLTYKKELSLLKEDYPLLIFFAAKIGNSDLLKMTLDDCRKYLDSVGDEEGEHQSGIISPAKEVNFQGYFNLTALHLATTKPLPNTVRFLLKAGADVNCRTQSGYTPLHFATCLFPEKSVDFSEVNFYEECYSIMETDVQPCCIPEVTFAKKFRRKFRVFQFLKKLVRFKCA